MAQEAKFELSKHRSVKQYEMSSIEYFVKLTDADGEVVRYKVTDYYNDSNEIVETIIAQFYGINYIEKGRIDIHSRLGKKILTFVTNEHFYRGDVIEAMGIKEHEDQIDYYYGK